MVSFAKLHAESSINPAWWYQLQDWFGLQSHPDLLEELRTFYSVATRGVGEGTWICFQLEALPHLPTLPQAQRKKEKNWLFWIDPFFNFALVITTSPHKKKWFHHSYTKVFGSLHKIKGGKVLGPWRPLDQFNFNKLAPVLNHLTQLILSCAVNHDTWFN